MKKYVPYLIISAMFFLLVFCQGSNEPLDENNFSLSDSINIQFQDTLFSSEENVWITFDSLLSESRCPVNVVCVWAGNASLHFTFSKDGEETGFNLNTHPDFLNDTTISGYRISLLDVKPYPHTDSLFTQNDYSAIISISNK